jgi:hypothetical protein
MPGVPGQRVAVPFSASAEPRTTIGAQKLRRQPPSGLRRLLPGRRGFMCLALSVPTYTASPTTTGRPNVSFPNATHQTMLRPVVASQSTGGLPVWTTVARSGGATEGVGTTCDATGSQDLTPAIRLNAHSASLRNVGSSAPPSAPLGPTVPLIRCFSELRPRRYAHKAPRPPPRRCGRMARREVILARFRSRVIATFHDYAAARAAREATP